MKRDPENGCFFNILGSNKKFLEYISAFWLGFMLTLFIMTFGVTLLGFSLDVCFVRAIDRVLLLALRRLDRTESFEIMSSFPSGIPSSDRAV
jgi:hypothetical protein